MSEIERDKKWIEKYSDREAGDIGKLKNKMGKVTMKYWRHGTNKNDRFTKSESIVNWTTYEISFMTLKIFDGIWPSSLQG